MSPLYRALHTKTLCVFAQSRAVVTDCRFCFRRLKEDGENEDITTGRKDELDRTAKTEGVSTGRNAVGMCCVLPLASS